MVSTIHKSKGSEFDNVFMLVSKPRHITDDELRRYYVGMTRAKRCLVIHTNGSLFSRLPADEQKADQNIYTLPDEIVLQLSHKDVNLGFFKSHKTEILSLRSGEKLAFSSKYFYRAFSTSPVAQLSQGMQEKLKDWNDKGYKVCSASIRFIVAWKPKDAAKEEVEHAVLLLDLQMTLN